MISLLFQNGWPESAVSGRGANHAGMNFSQTLGNHCLTINETLPAMASPLFLVSLVPEKPR